MNKSNPYYNAVYFGNRTEKTGCPVVTCKQFVKLGEDNYKQTVEAGLVLPQSTFDAIQWEEKTSKAGKPYFTAKIAVYGSIRQANGSLWINPYTKRGELQVFNAKKFATAPVGETAPVATDDIPF